MSPPNDPKTTVPSGPKLVRPDNHEDDPNDQADDEADDDEAGEDPNDDDDADDDDADDDDADDDDEPEAVPVAVVSPAPPARRAEPPAPPKGRRMTREDALGPRPPAATHWRCRRIDEAGQRTTLLYHDDGAGIATCEWSIRSCAADVIKQRWGAEGGSFVVQFIQTDERGQRRPCGRSRMLILSPPAATPRVDSTAPAPSALPVLGAGSDSFAQMFSLLAFMQDRDEKVRAVAREEARIANERYKADVELMMERDRLASKERIAQIEATARVAGRGHGGPLFDPDQFAHRIGEVVGAKLEEVYDDEPEPAPPPTTAGVEAVLKLVDMLQPLVQAIGPAMAQRIGGGGSPGVTH